MKIILNACSNDILYEYLSEEFIQIWNDKCTLHGEPLSFSREDAHFIETVEEMNYQDYYRNADNEYIFLRIVDIQEESFEYRIICHGEEESLEITILNNKKYLYIYDILIDEYVKYQEI